MVFSAFAPWRCFGAHDVLLSPVETIWRAMLYDDVCAKGNRAKLGQRLETILRAPLGQLCCWGAENSRKGRRQGSSLPCLNSLRVARLCARSGFPKTVLKAAKAAHLCGQVTGGKKQNYHDTMRGHVNTCYICYCANKLPSCTKIQSCTSARLPRNFPSAKLPLAFATG